MTGERRTNPEDERDDGTEATPEDHVVENPESTDVGVSPEAPIESEDPTLRLMASEYAIWGLRNNGRHVFRDS